MRTSSSCVRRWPTASAMSTAASCLGVTTSSAAVSEVGISSDSSTHAAEGSFVRAGMRNAYSTVCTTCVMANARDFDSIGRMRRSPVSVVRNDHARRVRRPLRRRLRCLGAALDPCRSAGCPNVSSRRQAGKGGGP